MSETSTDTVQKLPTGINGLDRLLGGGLPDRRLTLVLGNAGAGKSVLAMQMLTTAAARGEPGLCVGFEETPEEIRQNMRSFDWPAGATVDANLHLMEAAVDDDFFRAGDFDIEGLLAAVEARVDQTGARRVVFDGIDALLRALGSSAGSLRELLRLRRWIARTGVAVILTAKEEEPDGEYTRHFGFMPFVADCLVQLRHMLCEGVYTRSVRVVKHRGGGSGGTEVPFIIDERGIDVAFYGSRRLAHEVSTERVSSGIEPLDVVLGGGYLRGSSVLVSGAPGTAKTTLAGALAQAACANGERVVFVSFDESAVQIVRNMRSVGIELEPHVQSGALRLEGYRASGVSAEDHLIEIQRLIDAVQPRYLIVDPVSALAKAGGERIAANMTERLLDRTKSLGITVLMTTLLEDLVPDQEGTRSHVSTIADTWISLTYNVRAGERNRGLTVIKSRGSAHSKEVRELILQSEGPTLTEPYTAAGEVLMGTARLEREAIEHREEARRREEYAQQRDTLHNDITELEDRLHSLSRELEYKRQRLDALGEEEQRILESYGVERAQKRARRHNK